MASTRREFLMVPFLGLQFSMPDRFPVPIWSAQHLGGHDP